MVSVLVAVEQARLPATIVSSWRDASRRRSVRP
jgi:hypothetical protein